MTRPVLFSIMVLSVAPWVAACDRNQDQLTPAAQTEEGTKKAEEFPSTRNMENPDPSIGGTNSASTRPETHPSGSDPAKAPDHITAN